MQNHWSDIRCGVCRRKLGEGHYVHLAIKCPRCRAINHFAAPSHIFTHASERPASTRKDEHGNIPSNPL